MMVEFKVEEDILDYIIKDWKDILKDGFKESKEDFPMTEVLAKYLNKTSLDIRVIDGIIMDILMMEYINYLTR